MNEKIIRVVDEHDNNGILFQVVETQYEFGRHFVFLMNGEPGFHSTDCERVLKYMNGIVKMM